MAGRQLSSRRQNHLQLPLLLSKQLNLVLLHSQQVERLLCSLYEMMPPLLTNPRPLGRCEEETVGLKGRPALFRQLLWYITGLL